MDTIGRALSAEYPLENVDQTVSVEPMSEFGMQRKRSLLWPMLAVVGFVLLIACVNVANLMLARAASRSRELAIRATLGAGRWRIVRQLLTESLVLACAGGIGGLLIAYWGTRGHVPLLPASISASEFRPVDAVDASTSACSRSRRRSRSEAASCSAWRRRSRRSATISPARCGRTARGSTGDGKSRLRYGLVAIEVALTLIVLAGAGVMLVSVARLLGVDPGLDPRNVLVLGISPPQKELYYGPPENPQFCDRADARGGRRARRDLGGRRRSPAADRRATRAGRSASKAGPIRDPGTCRPPAYSVACPGTFATLGIPLVAGREFTARDSLEAPAVAVINRRFAREIWPGEPAVGKRFKIGFLNSDNPWMTVVGVVENFRHRGLDLEQAPSFYRPYHQAAWPVMSIVVKTAAAPEPLTKAITRAVAVVEPNQAVSGVRTMESVVGTSVTSRRFSMYLLSGFAVLALILAAVGIAGVVGYSVVQRTPEIGVRVALGARRLDVLRLILGHSLAWAIGGVVAGIAGAIWLLRLLGTMLYDVTPYDPGRARLRLDRAHRRRARRQLSAGAAGDARRRGHRAAPELTTIQPRRGTLRDDDRQPAPSPGLRPAWWQWPTVLSLRRAGHQHCLVWCCWRARPGSISGAAPVFVLEGVGLAGVHRRPFDRGLAAASGKRPDAAACFLPALARACLGHLGRGVHVRFWASRSITFRKRSFSPVRRSRQPLPAISSHISSFIASGGGACPRKSALPGCWRAAPPCSSSMPRA